jgi:hypothetical protein
MTLMRDLKPASSPALRKEAASVVPGSVCIVTLVDRRTGSALRVNGSRVSIYTRSPDIAAQELLAGRDPAVWDLRIQPLDPARRRE